MSNCALGADGKLLDASEIQFFNDVDDDVPISGPSNPPPIPIHPLFSRASPVQKVAGSRRTARVSRPSAKVIDPNNAETISRKRKAESIDVNPRPITRPTILDGDDISDDDDDNPPPLASDNASDDETTDEVDHDIHADDDELDDADAQLAYASTKEMGDADRTVCYLHSYKISHDLT